MFYPIWEAASLDEWLYNGGPYQMIVLHFLLGVAAYMGFHSWPIERVTFRHKTDSTLAFTEDPDGWRGLQQDFSRKNPNILRKKNKTKEAFSNERTI